MRKTLCTGISLGLLAWSVLAVAVAQEPIPFA